MNLDLSNKVALVCGGSKGLGFASAIELAKLGAKCILAARNEDALKKRVDELNILGKATHDYIIIDHADHDLLKSRVIELLDKFAIHILINNSGGPKGGNIFDASSEEFIDAFKKHVVANQILAQTVVPQMKGVGYGRIINIVSTSVRQPISGLGVSNTIRGSVASWSKSMSAELAPYGITVNNVLPGTTDTERINELISVWSKMYAETEEAVKKNMINELPIKRFAHPEEIGSVVAFLASPAASYLTGTSIPVDGGKIKSI